MGPPPSLNTLPSSSTCCLWDCLLPRVQSNHLVHELAKNPHTVLTVGKKYGRGVKPVPTDSAFDRIPTQDLPLCGECLMNTHCTWHFIHHLCEIDLGNSGMQPALSGGKPHTVWLQGDKKLPGHPFPNASTSENENS